MEWHNVFKNKTAQSAHDVQLIPLQHTIYTPNLTPSSTHYYTPDL